MGSSSKAERQLVEEASVASSGAPEVETCAEALRFFATTGCLDFAAAAVMDFDLASADAANQEIVAESTGEHTASVTVPSIS